MIQICVFVFVCKSGCRPPPPTCPGLDTDWPPARAVESRYEIRPIWFTLVFFPLFSLGPIWFTLVFFPLFHSAQLDTQNMLPLFSFVSANWVFIFGHTTQRQAKGKIWFWTLPKLLSLFWLCSNWFSFLNMHLFLFWPCSPYFIICNQFIYNYEAISGILKCHKKA